MGNKINPKFGDYSFVPSYYYPHVDNTKIVQEDSRKREVLVGLLMITLS